MEGGKKVEERTEKERRMKREWRKTKKGKTNERTQHGESNIGDLKGLCNEISTTFLVNKTLHFRLKLFREHFLISPKKIAKRKSVTALSLTTA